MDRGMHEHCLVVSHKKVVIVSLPIVLLTLIWVSYIFPWLFFNKSITPDREKPEILEKMVVKRRLILSANNTFDNISEKVKIFQHGTDGFGHQLEGIIRLISLSLNNKAEYKYNYKKKYTFEHDNLNVEKLNEYLYDAYRIISNNTTYLPEEGHFKLHFREQRNFTNIMKEDVNWKNTIYFYDGVLGKNGKHPAIFEPNTEVEKSLPKIREAFVEKNNYLPKKSYDNNYINVCCHVRLGDAVGTRVLDNDKLFEVVKLFQKNSTYRVIIHSDGDVSHLAMNNNTIIHDSKTDVLQVLSDFIFADILIMNYSALSISGHLLADNKQKVYRPKNAGPTFKDRVLQKCITFDDFLKENNKTLLHQDKIIRNVNNTKIMNGTNHYV